MTELATIARWPTLAAIQIAYNALPASITGNVAATAVVTAADNAVDTVAAKIEGAPSSASSSCFVL